jgi:hypothetical protein
LPEAFKSNRFFELQHSRYGRRQNRLGARLRCFQFFVRLLFYSFRSKLRRAKKVLK